MGSSLLHLFFFLLSFLPLALAQPRFSLNSHDPDPKRKSPSGEFAFGFYLVSGNRFLLATWFENIPRQTIIWTGNGGNPVAKGSKIELTANGQFVLSDPNGQEIWKAEATDGARFASVDMLDSGNFVLTRAENGDPIWTTFDNATDTILPGQTLQKGRKLSARLTEKSYTRGRFQLRFQDDGNLVSYPLAYPTETIYNAYWASNTVGRGDQLVFDNSSGRIFLNVSVGETFSITLANVPSGKDYYHRATIDSDGVFRQYFFPKMTSVGGSARDKWTVVRSLPDDICGMTDSGGLGSGICGFNSYCTLDDEQKPICKCPPGYSFIDEEEKYRGCKQDFVSHDCRDGSSDQFKMEELSNTNWPTSDYERYVPADEVQCRNACLEDCLCAVVIFSGSGCWKKKLPLSFGRAEPVDQKALFKVRLNASSEQCGEENDRRSLILTGSLLLGSSGFLNFLILVTIFLILLYIYHKSRRNLQPTSSFVGMNVQRFTYREMEQIANGFKEELGGGAFGTVYKGALPSDSRIFVAIKKLGKLFQQVEKEFLTEVNTIGHTHHKNLIRLLGYCDEGLNRILVYEFLTNGSLANFLFGSMRPNWDQRVLIAFGVARGLMYLHEECDSQIIHCDIKPENILLDDSFTAKISDFGLAKLLQNDQTRAFTSIRGTRGYVAPELFKNAPMTVKSDVYSFGVLLLEIICCRKNVELGVTNEEREILTDWAYDCYKEGRMDMLVENDDEALNDMKKVERLVMVAIWCIQEDPSLRPSMKMVIDMLDGVVNVYVPPNPASFLSFASFTS